MYKSLVLALIVVIGVASASTSLSGNKNTIRRTKVGFGNERLTLDLCPTCINIAEQSINILLNLILDSGIVGTCGTLCQALAQKTGSQIIGTVCDLVCDAVGIDEFIKLLNNADLDPIWYCEIAKMCPGKIGTES